MEEKGKKNKEIEAERKAAGIAENEEGQIYQVGKFLRKDKDFIFDLPPEKTSLREKLKKRKKTAPRLSEEEKKRRLPPWVLPLAIALFSALFIIYWAPGFFKEILTRETEGVRVRRDRKIYDENVGAVTAPYTFIYKQPDLRAEKLTSAIYNEAVRITEKDVEGLFYKIILEDGVMGYALMSEISEDSSHLEPAGSVKKVIVLSDGKKIMSHTTGGTPLISLPMGTVLYADYESVSVFRIKMAGGRYGWISTEGIATGEPFGELQLTDKDPGRFFNSSVMSFYNCTYVPGGMTSEGCDMAGIIYISGKLNGLGLSRFLQEQAAYGKEVDYSYLLPGDCIFFHDSDDEEKITNAAVVIEGSNVLMHKENRSVIDIINLDNEEKLRKRIKHIRRYF